MLSRKTIQFLLTVFFVLVLPLQASAISYDILTGLQQDGFAYSYIHAATNESGTSGMYPGGTLLFGLTGTLSGNLAGNTLTISPSTLAAQGIGGGHSGTYTLQLSNNVALDNSSGFAGGSMDYTILDPSSSIWDTGTFYFEALDLTGPTNTFSSSDIYLWGQNWDRNVQSRQDFIDGGGTPLGIDIGGVVPEPGSLILLGSGLVGLMGLRRKIK